MTAKDGKAKEIVLGDEFGDIAVKANGVRVEIHTNGRIAIHPLRKTSGGGLAGNAAAFYK
jgi:hypothetical protein